MPAHLFLIRCRSQVQQHNDVSARLHHLFRVRAKHSRTSFVSFILSTLQKLSKSPYRKHEVSVCVPDRSQKSCWAHGTQRSWRRHPSIIMRWISHLLSLLLWLIFRATGTANDYIYDCDSQWRSTLLDASAVEDVVVATVLFVVEHVPSYTTLVTALLSYCPICRALPN